MFLTREEKKQNANLLQMHDEILDMEGITSAYCAAVNSYILGWPPRTDAFQRERTKQDNELQKAIINKRHREDLDPTRAFNNMGKRLIGLHHSLINSEENDLMIRIASRIISSDTLVGLVPKAATDSPVRYIRTMEIYRIRSISSLLNQAAEYIQYKEDQLKQLEQSAGNSVIKIPANLAL